MSRHEGVSCDSCMKSNFRGRRYKCLICYDYDLCATCYEAGATTTRHTVDHAMQCILTRSDFDLYYGGEALTSEQPQAFTCPYCSKMGFTETTLQEHVTSEHPDSALEVVCPVCAALPGGDANHVTDDFAAHMTLEHRAPREFQDEPIGGIRHVRRIPHPGRGMGGPRARRSNMHFQSAGSTLSGLSPSSRENTMDPIAELLSQLSNVRSRAAAAQNVSSQLQQLEMQLQSTRLDDRLEFASLPLGFHRHTIARQQLEKLPRRQAEGIGGSKVSGSSSAQQPTTVIDLPSVSAGSSSSNSNSQFLLARFGESELSETERATGETERADRSLFVQELLLSTLAEGLRLDDSLPDTSSLASLYLSSIDQPQDSSPSPQPPVGGGGGGSEGGGGGSEPQNPPSGGGAPASSANSNGGGGGSTGGGGASAGAGVMSGLTNASSTTEALSTYTATPGAAAATNLPHGGEKKREKTSNSHRNLVKRLEAKKLEKEPPPSVLKAKKSQH